MYDDVEIPAVDIVLADKLGVIGLLDRRFDALTLADELAADIDEAMVRGHGAAGDQTALDEKVRIVPHDLAVLAGAGFGFIGIDDEIMRPAVGLFGHERPFQPGGKAGAAAAALAGGLDLIDDAVAAFGENLFGAVPSAAGAGRLKAEAVMTVEVFENAVLVGEH